MHEARIVFRKSDGLCCENPENYPSQIGATDRVTDEQVIERVALPIFCGKVSDYVVVTLPYPDEKCPWEYKWVAGELQPATQMSQHVLEWETMQREQEIRMRIETRRLARDIRLCEDEGDEEARDMLVKELNSLPQKSRAWMNKKTSGFWAKLAFWRKK